MKWVQLPILYLVQIFPFFTALLVMNCFVVYSFVHRTLEYSVLSGMETVCNVVIRITKHSLMEASLVDFERPNLCGNQLLCLLPFIFTAENLWFPQRLTIAYLLLAGTSSPDPTFQDVQVLGKYYRNLFKTSIFYKLIIRPLSSLPFSCSSAPRFHSRRDRPGRRSCCR